MIEACHHSAKIEGVAETGLIEIASIEIVLIEIVVIVSAIVVHPHVVQGLHPVVTPGTLETVATLVNSHLRPTLIAQEGTLGMAHCLPALWCLTHPSPLLHSHTVVATEVAAVVAANGNHEEEAGDTMILEGALVVVLQNVTSTDTEMNALPI
jgi:hypothetical protein